MHKGNRHRLLPGLPFMFACVPAWPACLPAGYLIDQFLKDGINDRTDE